MAEISGLNESISTEKIDSEEINFLKVMHYINRLVLKQLEPEQLVVDILKILMKNNICNSGWIIFVEGKRRSFKALFNESLIYNNNKIEHFPESLKPDKLPECIELAGKDNYFISKCCSKRICPYNSLLVKIDNSAVMVIELIYKRQVFGYFSVLLSEKEAASETFRKFLCEIMEYISFSFYSSGIGKKRELLNKTISENEKKYFDLFENTPVGLYTTDPMEKITNLNSRLVEILKFQNKEEISGKDISDFYCNTDDRIKWQNEIKNKGVIKSMESEWKCGDGSDVWISENAVVNKNAEGALYYEVSVEDITKRKKMEFDLAQTLSELKKTRDDLKNRNDWIESLNNISFQIARSHDLDSIFHIVLKELCLHLSFPFTGIGLFKSDKKAIELVCSVDENNNFPDLECTKGKILFDIENKYELLISGANDITKIDLNSIEDEDASSSFNYFLINLKKSGFNCLIVFPLYSEDILIGYLLSASENDIDSDGYEAAFLKGLTEYISIAVNNISQFKIIKDTYDMLKKAQDSMMEQERLKAMGQVASGISHDINNLLSPITLYTEALISTEEGLSERGLKFLNTIQNAVNDIENITSRLRTFYKKSDNTNLESISLKDIFQDVIQLTMPKLNKVMLDKNINIKIKQVNRDSMPAITCVKSELRESLINCIFNSIDALENGGIITLKGDFNDDYHIITVEDDGCGMPEDERKKCLEPFYTTKGENGSGLGLPEISGMVSRHSGYLEIDSSPGRGTSVSLFLPSQMIISDNEEVLKILDELKELKILCIDDDPRLLDVLSDLLSLEGHLVDTAETGQEALLAFKDKLLKNDNYHLVITDLGMPEMDGYEVAKQLKLLDPAIPVIMLTGWGNILYNSDKLPDNVDAVMKKPPKIRDLKRVIFEVIQNG